MTRDHVTRRAVLRRVGAAGALAATGLATGGTAAAQESESVAQVVAVAPDGGFRFEPERFEITAGDTVRWEWKSGGHNVSPTGGAQPAGADWEGDDADIYGAGHTYTHTFTVPGEYEYHCDPHRAVGMVGAFTVAESSGATCPTVDGTDTTDPDGDGLCEDFNGNDRLDFADVNRFFDNVSDPDVTDNADAFDFNDSGRVDFDDVNTLFDEV